MLYNVCQDSVDGHFVKKHDTHAHIVCTHVKNNNNNNNMSPLTYTMLSSASTQSWTLPLVCWGYLLMPVDCTHNTLKILSNSYKFSSRVNGQPKRQRSHARISDSLAFNYFFMNDCSSEHE